MNKILALLLTVFLSLGVALDAEAKEGWVLAVLSSDTPIYRKFIENYQKNLPADIKLSVVSGAEGLSGQTLGNHPDMILSVGSGAARQVRRIAPSVPVLYAMLLRQQYYAEIADSSRRDAAVFIDPPWRAQAELAKLVFPDLRSVGVVYTADSQPEVREIVREFKGKGIAVVSAKVDESGQAYEPIQEVLAKSDVLLAIQDSAIYNSNSIRNILLTSFATANHLSVCRRPMCALARCMLCLHPLKTWRWIRPCLARACSTLQRLLFWSRHGIIR